MTSGVAEPGFFCTSDRYFRMIWDFAEFEMCYHEFIKIMNTPERWPEIAKYGKIGKLKRGI